MEPQGITGNWRLAFHDEFEGTELKNNLWNTQYPWGIDNNGDGSENCYLTGNVSLNGSGQLVLTARHGKVSGRSKTGAVSSWPYNSGQINTHGKFSMDRGFVEMRAKVPSGSGAWPAFWALPSDGSWPPEVDVMETYGNAPNVLDMTYHWGTAQRPRERHSQRTLVPPNEFADRFHVYGCHLSSQAITWYLDGVMQWSVTNRNEIAQLKPLYLVCNLAVGGSAGDPSKNTWPQEYLVDYVRAWVGTNASEALHRS
jgi:beta-glucanase (GH16 family)